MTHDEAVKLIKESDWFEYDQGIGLRLDGYFGVEVMQAFIFMLEHHPQELEELSQNARWKKRYDPLPS